MIVQPAVVLDCRVLIQGEQHTPQVKIQRDQGSETTWENVKDMQDHYPLFNLEEKIELIEGSIVMRPDAIIKQ